MLTSRLTARAVARMTMRGEYHNFPDGRDHFAAGTNVRNILNVNRRVEIFCPKCEYVPRRSDLWACEPSCGCQWHTFDTCGVCPNCGKNWEDTQCPTCARWSPHVAWYHDCIEQERVEEMVVQA